MMLSAYARHLRQLSDEALRVMLRNETSPERREAIEVELDRRNPSPWEVMARPSVHRVNEGRHNG